MRKALWVLLALAPQYIRAATPSISTSQEPVPNISTPMNEEDLHRANSTRNIPGIRACQYYSDNAKIYDIMRLEMHSKTCRSDAAVDDKLPDRPEIDEYQVDGVFDTPNRF
ncbi:MAG TPA: hypothetical protein VF412_01220 [Bdellovibrio sp.]|uniref:hypothetical protein n=1 Tax=Bdellovibrio sp. TaxID=28201 RepID=UPI002F2271D5